jgi:hypothetical protein
MNTKVEVNFVAHNLDTEFALFVVRTWGIWCRQGRVANLKNLDEADFMETKFASLPRRISYKARWSMMRTWQPCLCPCVVHGWEKMESNKVFQVKKEVQG